MNDKFDMKDIYIEYDSELETVLISTETSSGAEYEVKNKDDLLLAVATYIKNYV